MRKEINAEIMNNRFNSDTDALKRRERLNAKAALHNLEDWIIGQVKPYKKMRILDLGCGTGKQIFPLSNIVSSDGSILGIDISDKAVKEVNQKAEEEKLSQIKAVRVNLDQSVELLRESKFDLILSTYAIYYAEGMNQLLIKLNTLLNPGGRIFICGPGQGTNQEMIDLINNVQLDPPLKGKPIEDFISQSALNEIAAYYSGSQTVRLANHMQFTKAEDVLQWWKSHNSFIPKAYGNVAGALRSHFSQHGQFKLTKNILGVHFYA